MLTYNLTDRVHEDTMITPNSSTRVENIFTNIDRDVSLNVVEPNVSDHRGIFFNFSLSTPKMSEQYSAYNRIINKT